MALTQLSSPRSEGISEKSLSMGMVLEVVVVVVPYK